MQQNNFRFGQRSILIYADFAVDLSAASFRLVS